MGRLRQLLYSDETLKLELLNTPVRDLGLSFGRTKLGECVAQVRREVRETGFVLRPSFYLSDEYGTVAGTANIGIGFWDAQERLRELNREFRGSLWSWDEILRVLRHEVGHAFCYSYRLYRRPDFRETFDVRGHFFHTYPETSRFSPHPWSRDYVNPFGDHYAQRHPDEDFAETFSEWLTYRTWRRKYRAKPGAIRKLEYVDARVRELARTTPPVRTDPKNLDVPVESMTLTVAEFFQGATRKYRRRARGYVDRELRGMFRVTPNGVPTRPVVEFLNETQRTILARVPRIARVDESVVRDLIEKLRARASAMGLLVKRRDERKALLDVTALLTTLATRYEILGRLK